MDRKKLRLLLIDDSEADAERLLRKLSLGGYDPMSIRVENAHALSRAMLYGTWDLAVCDYSMPNFSGAEALKQVKAQNPTLPFMFVSGTLPSDLARQLQDEGAAGVLSKDNLDSFLPAVEMILRSKGTPLPASAEPGTDPSAPPETVESLQKERAKLIVQISALEQTAADLRTRLDRATRSPSDPVAAGSATKPKILLVDDREDNLNVLESLIGDLNATTLRATSGPEALERLLEEDFALVLMDVLMPGMDGFETATLVHRRKRSRSTPIVFLTAHGDDPALILRGYKAGAVDYLQKPIVPEILKSKVAIFLELHEKNELLRRQAASLVSLNAELEAFSGSVSHDLKAPLRAIRAWTQIVLEEYSGKTLDEEAQAKLRRVLDSGNRMDGLIGSLLSYAKISRANVTIERLDLISLVRDALEPLRSELEQRGAELRIAETLGCVMAHRTSLVQAIHNLVSNAIKFVQPGTRPAVRLWSELQQGRRRLWVEDNGIGIDAADRERIFRPFERLHSQKEYAGHGMGLAIVQRAVERLAGGVGVESEPGRGSRFWIDLPPG
jgi:signal transduction histidine kinase